MFGAAEAELVFGIICLDVIGTPSGNAFFMLHVASMFDLHHNESFGITQH